MAICPFSNEHGNLPLAAGSGYRFCKVETFTRQPESNDAGILKTFNGDKSSSKRPPGKEDNLLLFLNKS